MAISKGDRVHWQTSQGTTTGHATHKRTRPFQHDEQRFNASPDDPYWIVESEKTGATAAHKESSAQPGVSVRLGRDPARRPRGVDPPGPSTAWP